MLDKETSFKERLESEIEYNGFSKTDFAYKAGISLATLNMYLYKNSIPAADTAVKMAEVLNTTVEYLVTGRNFKNKSNQYEWKKNELLRLLNSLDEQNITFLLEVTKLHKKIFDDDCPTLVAF